MVCVKQNALSSLACLPCVPIVHAVRNRVSALPDARASGPDSAAVLALHVDENALTGFAGGVNFPELAVLRSGSVGRSVGRCI
jgi:hypothetical protein